ncbi:zf-HC2 domain-containing protein [Benzoatithermus flavus]|uniref:Zf-HC2 domain-containing protein n=1 Tax=Benzoatithermus flavus TaxID=3108223 RepID=A0ABU8XRL9_9PROT
MQCGDLERYLEAFLDGRLGRSRSAILRRHLAICGGCRARVERLRQFEREMQRRFRSMEQVGSVWQGLELDLVASSRSGAAHHLLPLPRVLPPPRSSAATETPPTPGPNRHRPLLVSRVTARGRASGLVGVVLIAMALGTVYQLARTSLRTDDGIDPTVQAYSQLIRGDHVLALRSDDAERLQAWLSQELERPVPPLPIPEGFRPVGADRAELATGEAGVLIYGRSETAADAETPVALFVQPLPAEARAPAPKPSGVAALHDAGDLRELTWETGSFRYTVIGRGTPEEELRRFVP